MVGKEEIEVARRLFEEGWSSGNPEAVRRFLTEDVVLRDVLSGAEAIRGWANVNGFWEDASRTLKVPVEDRITIIEELHKTGKLHARLVVEE